MTMRACGELGVALRVKAVLAPSTCPVKISVRQPTTEDPPLPVATVHWTVESPNWTHPPILIPLLVETL